MENTNIRDLTHCRLSEVVRLEPFIASEVKLGRDIWRKNVETNRQRLENYVPTEASRKALKGMLKGTSAAKTDRVHLLTGSYGTGKSYLLLVLANLLGRDMQGGEVETLIERVRKKGRRYGDNLSDTIDQARNAGRYLVVVPDYAEKNFKRALLDALRRALEQEEIDYRPKTEYRRVSDLLERWSDNDNPVLDELKKRASEDGTTLKRLKAVIEQDYQEEALRKVEGYYKDTMDVGLPYEDIKIEDTYKDVGRYVRSEHGIRGISILFDEFGNFLSKFVNQPDAADGQEIQDFIEFVKSVQSPRIMLVMAAHRSVADYAKGDVSKKDIKKVSGRFQKRHRLTVSGNFDEAEEMIFNTIVDTKEKKEFKELIEEKLEKRYKSRWKEYLSAWYSSRSEEWRRETIAIGCYPLHPATVRVLPKLSDRVGQSTRTMFKYMSPDEDGGISSFIQGSSVINEHGQLELLTIDQLYDYFLGSADTQDAGIEAAQIKRRYTRARGNIQVEDPLAARLLKATAILRVVTDKDLQSTGENLIWALNLSSKQEEKAAGLLEVLARQGALRKNKTTGVYKFRGAGEVSVDEIHQKYLKEETELTAGEELDIYQSVLNLENREIRPYGYNDKHVTNRKAISDYVIEGSEQRTIEKWKRNLNKVYESGEGNKYKGNIIVLTGLAKSRSEKESIVRAYNGISEDLKKYFVLRVSIVGDGLTECTLQYEAARKTVEDEKVEKNEDAKEESLHLLDECKTALEEALERELRPENFEWYYRDEKKYAEGDLSESDYRDFIDGKISTLFNRTPKISNNVIQHYPEGGDYKRKKRRRAMNILIDREEFSFDGTSQEENMIEGLLKPAKMFEKTSNTKNNKSYVKLRPPQDESASKVWQVLKSYLCSEGPESRLQTAVRVLYHAPYGLSHPAVDMFLAAFVGYHSEEFTLREARRSVALSGENLSEARGNPSQYSLRFQALTPTQKRYLNEIQELVESVESDGGLWTDAAQALLDWYEKLPHVTKSFAPDKISSIKKAFGPLSKIDRDDSEVDQKRAKKLLSRELPQEFGVNPDQIKKSDSAKDDLIGKIANAIDEAERYELSFAEEVLEEVSFKAFDKEFSSSHVFKETVNNWIKGISIASKQHFREEGGRVEIFLQEVKREGDIINTFMVEIPRRWDGMTSYTEWSTPDERHEYVENVVGVIQKVESYEASPVPLLSEISKAAFETKVESELEFKELVINWFESLEPEVKSKLENGGFSDKSTALRKAIEKSIYTGGSVAEHFLKYLPERLNISGGGWPNIPDHGRRDLAVSVQEAVQEVDSWKPPLSTSEMAERLLRELSDSIWKIRNFEDPKHKLESKSQEWYHDLPPAIERADFGETERKILEVLEHGFSLQETLERDIPDVVGVTPPSEAGSAEAGEKIVEEVKEAFEKIDSWERPMQDLIERVGSEAYLLADCVHQSEVTLNFRDWWKGLDHKPQKSDFDSETLAYHLVHWGRSSSGWETVLPSLIRASSLSEEYLYWSAEQDIKFANELNEAQGRVEEWEPPEPSGEEIRAKIRELLNGVEEEMNISMQRIVEELKNVIENID